MASLEAPGALRNLLLAGLSPVDRNRALRRLKAIRLARGAVLQQEHADVRLVYFPLTSVVGALRSVDRGAVQTATIGRESAVGLGALVGASAADCRYQVLIGGEALVGEAAALRRVPALRGLAARALQAYAAKLAQAAACAQAHSLRQRCCRRLLCLSDGVAGEVVPITHDALARTLGVRRATVTVLASELRRAGLIAYRHGRLTLTDPAALEREACDCGRRLREAYARLLGPRAV